MAREGEREHEAEGVGGWRGDVVEVGVGDWGIREWGAENKREANTVGWNMRKSGKY